MKITRARTSVFALLMLTLAPAVAQAQFTVYTNLADYLAAVSLPGTDTFNDLNVTGFPVPALNRTTNGATPYVYSVTALNEAFVVGTDADEWLSTNDALDALTFDLSASGVAGIGGFFFGTGLAGDFLPGAGIQLTATNAVGATVITLFPSATSTFRGFVSENGNVTSLAVLSIQNGDVVFPTVNDLVLGSAPASVPEPSSFALIAAGALGLAVASRRRRTA
jgi:hypothetical protein